MQVTPDRKISARMLQSMASWLQDIWYGTPTAATAPSFVIPLLSLGARLYESGLIFDQCRAERKRRSLPSFVISVGNITVGGTGKTPFTLWLARFLRERGFHPAILSRGYGRKSSVTGRVPTHGELFSCSGEFGDEPTLMARKMPSIPIWVGRDRWTSGSFAIQGSEVDMILLDDGFQHMSLSRDLDIVLLDAANPVGNGFILPRGPLREPIANLCRADAFVLTRSYDRPGTSRTKSWLGDHFPGIPVFACAHRLTAYRAGPGGPRIPVDLLREHPVYAFAGIARPEQFFQSVREFGIELSGYATFPDHHAYSSKDADRLLISAMESGAQLLITTEKDAVRLPEKLKSIVMVAEMELDFGPDDKRIAEYFDTKLKMTRP